MENEEKQNNEFLSLMADLPDNADDNKHYIRIDRIVLNNFKDVVFGDITLNCGKEKNPFNTHSDILGIYGQNGSGKTSTIEALSILKFLLSGRKIPDVYANCIRVGSPSSTLSFTFSVHDDMQNRRQLVYTFSIRKVAKETSSESDNHESSDQPERYPYRVEVFNERLDVSGPVDGKTWRLSTFINTESDSYAFVPFTRYKELISQDKKVRYNLFAFKDIVTKKESRSFIFSPELFHEIKNKCGYSEFYVILNYFRLFALRYFYVVDTKSSGLIRLNIAVPLITRYDTVVVDNNSSTWVSKNYYDILNDTVSRISIVLSSLIPGLTLKLHKTADRKSAKGVDGFSIELMANRNGTDLPASYESDGVRKIISILELFITAFNEPSCTVAIDEFDAGVFEYLLGELLAIFEESGKGQLIFTSHNLRPLEVINDKFLVFTTTNPNNRFIHFKGVGNTNNLRSKYFKEIILGSEQDEEIYNSSKRFKLKLALSKAKKLEGE